MLELDHTLIVKLVTTYQDQDRFYFIMEYVHGMDLFDALRYIGLLNEPSS